MEYDVKELLYSCLESNKGRAFCTIREDNKDIEIMYEDLENDIRRYMSLYNRFSNGTHIGLLEGAGYNTVVAMMAAFLMGRFLTVIDNSYQWELAYPLLERADVSVVICGKEKVQSKLPTSMEWVDVNEYKSFTPMDKRDMPKVNEHDSALLLYTSGTTGKNKGVEISFHAIYKAIDWYIELLGGDSKVFYSVSPCHHIFFINQLFYVLRSGSKIIFSNPDHMLFDDMSEYHPSVLFAVPMVLYELINIAHKSGSESLDDLAKNINEITG